MGQKVNPISMRLQVNKQWKSRWFAEGQDYRKKLTQDLEIREIIKDKVGRRGSIDKVLIERTPSLVTIGIYTAKAGVVIGRGGSSVEALKNEIDKIIDTPVRVNIEEIKKPELHAKLVADNIAHQLERRISFRRATKSAASATMRAGAEGVKIQVSGRLNNAEMARIGKEIKGSIPLHTLRADIDYGYSQANTRAGTVGVKVWIYKGDILEQ